MNKVQINHMSEARIRRCNAKQKSRFIQCDCIFILHHTISLSECLSPEFFCGSAKRLNSVLFKVLAEIVVPDVYLFVC